MTKPTKKPKTPRTGRPPLDPADRRSTIIRVLVTEAEHQELAGAAESAGLNLSTWIRVVALDRARAKD